MRIFLVHGWGGFPGWFSWLKREFKEEAIDFLMPDPDEPKIDEWVSHLREKVGKPDEDTFFVGHSMGCQTILRYLESLPANKKVGKVILVAGFVHLKSIDDPEDEKIAKPWLETPLDWAKIRSHCSDFFALFSDNDPWVPVDDAKIFEKKLKSKVVVQHNKEHFVEIEEIPIVLDELRK